MNDQNGRHARLRHTATGALAALAAVGAIIATTALAANGHPRAAVVNRAATKAPASPAPDKIHAPKASPGPQPFLNAVQRLVDNGTITATEGQTVDREIVAGRVDTETLASSGFTPTQLQAVQQALGNTKRSLAPAGSSAGPDENGTPPQGAKACPS